MQQKLCDDVICSPPPPPAAVGLFLFPKLLLKLFLAYADFNFNILGGSSLSCIASEAVKWI